MIQKTEKPVLWKSLLLAGVLLGALSGCGGGGGNGGGIPTPEPEPEPEVTTGQVSLVPDWGGMTAPSALRFHFYPASGSVITKECDASGFSGALEAGTYGVLAYNTDATGVTFLNTESYATAAVRIGSAEVPTRALSFIGMPDKLYAVTMDNLTVEKGGTVSQTPAATNLIRPLTLRFIIDDGSVISSIEGYLNGFYPSVLLSTGQPDEASLPASAETGVLFDVAVSGNDGNAGVNSLGILDPANGTAYQSVLMLNITVNDGRSTQTSVDLSQALTKILAANEGVLPNGTPAEITIKLQLISDIDFAGSVSDWKQGEDSGSIVA